MTKNDFPYIAVFCLNSRFYSKKMTSKGKKERA